MLKLNYRIGQLMIAMLLSTTLVFAQDRTVTGTVTDENNDPVPGATVQIKGTSSGTITDATGNFSVSAGSDAVLVFSFIGYQTQEITVGSQSTINVSLATDVTQLQEVIVTGYASQQKKDLTGSVGVVETEELVAMPTGNVASQLQGRASGVTVTGSGQPGTTSKVRIRGFGSFQNNDPLYVVDGVPTQDISTLNPADIESMSVLKDAGAASIYGSRASNGVIIISTKSGKSGSISVNYDMYYGSQNPGNGPEGLLNTQQYADLQWQVYDNDGTSEVHPIYGDSNNPSPTLPSWAADTDWYDEFTDNAGIMNHDISMSGGNDKSKFFAGIGYFSQDGIVKHTYSERLSTRFNSEFTLGDDRVKIGTNFTITLRKGNGVTNLAEGSPIQMGSYRSQPIISAIMDQTVQGISHLYVPGEWGGTGLAPRLGNGQNVLADLTRDKDDETSDMRLLGSVFLDVKIIDGLNFRTTFGGTRQNGYFTDYNFATYENSENVSTPSFTEGAWFNQDWVWTNTLTYNTSFGESTLLAVAGYEAVTYGVGRNVSGQRAGYFSDNVDFRSLNTGAQIVNANSSANTETTLASTFIRADYGFKDKYLISATVRRDGSSRFGADTRYGTFPSFSAGWRMSDEAFMSGVTWINDLKIRGGYGTMGNQLAISPVNQFFLYGGDAGSSNYDINGAQTNSVQGFRPTTIGNPDAKWETNVTTNVGFDAGFADNKIELIFDWYQKDTEDLLYQVELPGTAGAATPPFVNIASMRNTGFDIQLIYRNQWGDFGFEGNLTWSTYNNEIVALAPNVDFFDAGGSRIGSFSRNAVGQPVSSFFGYQVAGLFQNDGEATASGQDGAEAGFFKFQDTDGSGGITPDDRDYIGNPNPDYTMGLNLLFTFKNFDLTTFFYSSQGNDIFNWNLWWTDFWPSFQGQKSENLLNAWTPSNTGATTPKASNKSNFSTNTQSTSYYIEDGSYFRMKNIQLGYNFNPATLGNSGIKSLRIYLQGVNLFTATNYSGLDPELAGPDTDFGVDRGNYPNVKQYLVGLNIGF